jgi:hypothetical protein
MRCSTCRDGVDRSGLRVLRWTYTQERLVLFFEDQNGFGRFRLTPSSRAEYQRVLASEGINQ